MGQDLLLKIDVTAQTSNAGKSQAVDKSLEQDNAELKPFSTALENELEKQPVKQKQSEETMTDSESESVDSALEENPSAEDIVMQNGKILPEETEEAITQQDLPEVAVGVVAEAAAKQNVPEIAVEATVKHSLPEVAVAKRGASEVAVAAVAKHSMSEVASVAVAKHHLPTNIDTVAVEVGVKTTEETTKAAASLNNASLVLPVNTGKYSATVESKKEGKAQGVAVGNTTELKTQQVLEAVKSAVIVDESNDELKGLSSDKKQQGPSLRSDIWNALTKKTGDSNSKIQIDGDVVKTEKTITAQLLDKPLNDVRKMAELLNQKQPELPSPKATSERSFSGLNTALTSGMGSVQLSPSVQGTAVNQPVLALQPSMQSEAWGRVLSSRVVWMAREGVQQAELRLNPANLGPVEVKLHMNNDQANVTFVAQNAATRDALEQALPRLRESFQENGMDLANADVSEQASEQEGEETTDSSSQVASGNVDNEDIEAENQHGLIESDELELGRVSLFA